MIRLTIDGLYNRMPWDDIDAIVFDVGQVLLRFDAPAILRRILPEHPKLHAELASRIFQTPYWVMMDRGTITMQEAATAMTANAPQDLVPYILRVMESWDDMDLIEEGLRTLHACKDHGKKVYVLSNYGGESFAHALQRHDFFNLFDGIVLSSQHLLVKPQPELYAITAEQFRLDPARTLFIDDSHANIEAALNVGWHGLCFNRAGKLDDFFLG